MYTGIVQGLHPVVAVADERNLRRLTVAMPGLTKNLTTGASVAINGVCLTVTGCAGEQVTFDVIQGTLDHTNLGALAAGDLVNVERSARVGDEIGGHVVSGHVRAAVPIVDVREAENLRVLTFGVPAALRRYLPLKGFVALDGASLTISAVTEDTISVSLIPETISRTTLGQRRVGERVNLELDAHTQAVVETVEQVLADPEFRRRLGAPG